MADIYSQAATPADLQTAKVMRECARRWEERYPPIEPGTLGTLKEDILIKASRARAAELRGWAADVEAGEFWTKGGVE